MEENPKEYVKIDGVWQKTNVAWWVDKDKMNSPKPGSITFTDRMYNLRYYSHPNDYLEMEDYQCISHVHHWKTKLEEYCKVNEVWACVRCGDIVPDSIQSMIKLYRPLKDVNL